MLDDSGTLQKQANVQTIEMVLPMFTLIASIVPVVVYMVGASVYLAQPMPMHYQRWWTVLFAIVAHADSNHLWSNMLTQVLLCVVYEQWNGPLRTAIVYLLAGICGAVGQAVVYSGSPTILLGASGAIFGLGGACIGSITLNPERYPYPWAWVLYATIIVSSEFYALYSETESSIARSAHLIGGVTGLLVGLSISVNVHQMEWERVMQWIALMVTVILVLSVVVGVWIWPM
jgi:rhomboid protease GluP